MHILDFPYFLLFARKNIVAMTYDSTFIYIYIYIYIYLMTIRRSENARIAVVYIFFEDYKTLQKML